MSAPAAWCLASTEPGRAMLPKWDQLAAANRDNLAHLVDKIAALPAACGCGRTLADHLMVTVAVLEAVEPKDRLTLLAEALHQLAAAKLPEADR